VHFHDGASAGSGADPLRGSFRRIGAAHPRARLYVTCSDPAQLPEMERYGLRRRSTYKGPGSFTHLFDGPGRIGGARDGVARGRDPQFISRGPNPASIEAVTRRLAKILKLPLDLDSLRAASTEWELEVSSAIERNAELANTVRGSRGVRNELLAWDADRGLVTAVRSRYGSLTKISRDSYAASIRRSGSRLPLEESVADR